MPGILGILIAILVGLAIGGLIGGGLILAWSLAGFVVAVVAYVRAPPPGPAPGAPCSNCIRLQNLWNSMSWAEKAASMLNFMLASTVCRATGCGWLDLSF
jgi:hypothetical protein